MNSLAFDNVARLPLPGDNVAIATRRLEKGTCIVTDAGTLELDATVLEGHRFACTGIAQGEQVQSWNLPFGTALQDIVPGQYICNDDMLEALRGRSVALDLPPTPNFASEIPAFQLDEQTFRPGSPTQGHGLESQFQGYPRPGTRGTGTRNYILLLGTSSLAGGFVRVLEDRLRQDGRLLPNVDGIVAVSHTEGGVPNPNNREMVLRTLAGYLIHPNAGAVLAVDYGSEPITNALLRDYMEAHGYPLDRVLHRFLSVAPSFEQALDTAAAQVRSWYDEVNGVSRASRPVSDLKLALQCGGSDAFSGISGNPLAAWVARELIANGGAANLAETDELIGAEPYVLQNVRDLATARRFLEVVERFKQRAARHGHSAEGNPSGGNKFRGLYNIFLKSIGAAMKRHPDVRLDWVIEYGEIMAQSGFYFMDSPGNDLESIAGQVASGSNVIFFVTGNGSITNFPFVPTIKIVTTSERFALLQEDMDVNAGQYLDGTDMDVLGQSLYDLTLAVSGGQRTVGERAGHAQIQLWRNWTLDSDDQPRIEPSAPLSGQALPVQPAGFVPTFRYQGEQLGQRVVPQTINMIVPTSLCSGQIAHLAVRRLTQALGARGSRHFATIVHHEGCGVSSGSSEELYARTLAGYVQHPQVAHCLLLEHGCEKTHNDFMAHVLDDAGIDTSLLGWASVQLDGGIVPVLNKIEAWFQDQMGNEPDAAPAAGGLDQLRVAIASQGPLSAYSLELLAQCARTIAHAGGMVVVPGDSVVAQAFFPSDDIGATLAYAQRSPESGLQIMDCPTLHWVESLAGLGATGVDLILVHVAPYPVQGHPLIPTLQIATDLPADSGWHGDLDLVWNSQARDETQIQALFDVIGAVLSGHRRVRSMQIGNVDFQITRGPTGLSL